MCLLQLCCKNIKKYTDAGLTMSFLTVVPSSIKDSVIEDMGRVWCASDRQKSFQNAMAGFLPDNDSSEKCKNLVIKQSELADRLGVTVTPAMVVLGPSVHTFWVVFLQIKFSLNSSKRTKRMVTWR
jgi:thiol:disulfide interchange protein DsbC